MKHTSLLIEQLVDALFALLFFNTWMALILWLGQFLLEFDFSYWNCLGAVTLARGIVWTFFFNIKAALEARNKPSN